MDIAAIQMEHPNTPEPVPEPELFYNAITGAQEQAKEIDYCRVDLMLKGKEIYFSEITLSPRRTLFMILCKCLSQ